MGFSLYFLCENEQVGRELVWCLNWGGCGSRERVNFENKYFRGAAPVKFVGGSGGERDQGPFAVVFVYFDGILRVIREGERDWQDAECKVLLCEKGGEEIESFCEEMEIEVVIDSIQNFSGFIRNDCEYQGIGRIKEALECAAASYLTELEEVKGDCEPNSIEAKPKQEPEKKEDKEEEKLEVKEVANKENSEKKMKKCANDEDLEDDLQNFDYFLSKIKQNCLNSKNLDDETRRKNAENTIIELAKYLALDDSDEDS